jgi:hypothetical protein
MSPRQEESPQSDRNTSFSPSQKEMKVVERLRTPVMVDAVHVMPSVPL